MINYKNILFFLLLFILCLQGNANNNDSLIININPQKAGYVLDEHPFISKYFHIDSINTDSILFYINLKTGWEIEKTDYKTSKNAYVSKLTVHAKELKKSVHADSLTLSEVFFLSGKSDTLTDWIEITNMSSNEVDIENFIIETNAGSFRIRGEVILPPESCAVIEDTANLKMNSEKDYLIFADSSGAVISKFSWNAKEMNFPEDSIFSLEKNDVFNESNDDNWNVIYGPGRAAKLPAKYAKKLAKCEDNNLFKYAFWGGALLLFIIVLIFTFRGKKN